jgi:hypothetical protein
MQLMAGFFFDLSANPRNKIGHIGNRAADDEIEFVFDVLGALLFRFDVFQPECLGNGFYDRDFFADCVNQIKIGFRK